MADTKSPWQPGPAHVLFIYSYDSDLKDLFFIVKRTGWASEFPLSTLELVEAK